MSKLSLRISTFLFIGIGCFSAANAAIVQTVRYSETFRTSGGERVEATAWCQPGEVASGGGYQLSYGEGFFAFYNAAVTNGSQQGWRLTFILESVPVLPYVSTGNVRVVCLKQQ
jgi:hypothetical protein